MGPRDQRLVDEIKWVIKLRTPQAMMGIKCSQVSSMEEAYGEISDFINSEGIRPIIQLHDEEQHRYMIVLGVSPPWGVALCRRRDSWNYMQVVETLKGVIGG